MTIFVQVISIFAMLAISYLGLLAFGPPPSGLLYTKDTKRQWDSLVRERLGTALTATNIVGTLTSFATVFLFFLGNAAPFGAVLAWCSVTIWFGAFFTNKLTAKIIALPRVREALKSQDQTGGIIAYLFWDKADSTHAGAFVAKLISVMNIAGVVWLEFALLGDFGGAAIGITNYWMRALLLTIVAVAVIYFVLRFGVRGFVFADLFQVPVIAACTALLLTGAVIAAVKTDAIGAALAAVHPSADGSTVVLFALHVLFLNSFLVVVTEPHWLRTWVFGDQVLRVQWKATLGTAVVWVFLAAAGLIAAALSGNASGSDAVVALLKSAGGVSVVFMSAFWLGAIAALFSTADTQLYSLLLVAGFSVSEGKLSEQKLARARPLLHSVLGSILLGAAYLGARMLSIPAEKLVFAVIPMSLNVLPGLTQLARRGKAGPSLMSLSLSGYLFCIIRGFLAPASEMRWTLAAAAVPVSITLTYLAVERLRETLSAGGRS